MNRSRYVEPVLEQKYIFYFCAHFGIRSRVELMTFVAFNTVYCMNKNENYVNMYSIIEQPFAKYILLLQLPGIFEYID